MTAGVQAISLQDVSGKAESGVEVEDPRRNACLEMPLRQTIRTFYLLAFE